ncbi:hypothetical protein [Micromonospora sp. NPDC047740]|uniref:hypothetical protein n=1 Tax=Micromonospora sp. NPDC047740 TaxID=3364254 RepID=UPI0037100766
MKLTGGALAVLPLVLAVALAGCGSEDGGGTVASAGGGTRAQPSAAASLSREEMGVKFAQCMRENGVDMADPEPGKGPQVRIGGGTSEETVNKAMEACRQYNPMADASGGNAQMDENNRKFATCMRDNGVEQFPDPEPGQMGVRIDGKIAEDPDFAKAQQQCQSILAGSR